MKKLKIAIVALAVTTALSSVSFGQYMEPRAWGLAPAAKSVGAQDAAWRPQKAQSVEAVMLSAGLNIGIPIKEFDDAVPNIWGIGGTLEGLARIGYSPLHAGAQLGAMIYGKDTEEEPNGLYKNTRNNMIFSGHLMARIAPSLADFPVMPYFDGMFGFKHLYTENRVRFIGDPNLVTEPLAEFVEFSDWALSYGGSVGLRIGSDEVSLDLRFTYLLGGEAEYLTADSITFPDAETIVIKPFKSRTDMIIPQIGIIVVVE